LSYQAHRFGLPPSGRYSTPAQLTLMVTKRHAEDADKIVGSGLIRLLLLLLLPLQLCRECRFVRLPTARQQNVYCVPYVE